MPGAAVGLTLGTGAIMGDVLILCYHGVSRTWPAEISVTPDAFERQLEWLCSRGYRGVTFTDAVRDPPSGRAVAVTFDDAYRSVIEIAEPILTGLGLAATVFVPTGHTDERAPMSWAGVEGWHGGSHESELLPMGWAGLRELADRGWEVGSHTRTHPRLPRLDDGELRGELRDSKDDCEHHLGRPCTSIAYPFGDHDQRVAAAAADAGYLAGCGVRPIGDARDPLRRTRVGVYRSDDERRFRRKTSRPLRRIRASPAWGLVRMGRNLTGPARTE